MPPAERPFPPRLESPIVSAPMDKDEVDAPTEAGAGPEVGRDVGTEEDGMEAKADPSEEAEAAEARDSEATEATEAAERDESTLTMDGSSEEDEGVAVTVCWISIRIVTRLLAPFAEAEPLPLADDPELVEEGEMVDVLVPAVVPVLVA